MSWYPLSRSQLEFIADEFWPGGGENGDGRDLYGVAKYEGKWVEETTDADLIAEALHPSDADYYTRHRVWEMDDEAYERFCEEDESDEDGHHISVNGGSFDDWLLEQEEQGVRVGLELQAEYRELQRQRWNEAHVAEAAVSEFDGVASSMTSEAARDLERFERDGVRQISSRQAARAEYGSYFCRCRDDRRRVGRWRPTVWDPERGLSVQDPRYQGRGRGDSWKRHRAAQYRPVLVSPRVTDRIAA